MDYILQLFKALANERRLKIVRLLWEEEEVAMEDIAQKLKIPLATCCRNLKLLEKAYVVLSRYKNGRALYRLNQPTKHVYNKLALELINLANKRKKARK